MVKFLKKKSLPINNYKTRILDQVHSNKVLVLIGQTGSGKTTQVPQFLLQHNLNEKKLIGITQPRRIAAITVAKRVAYQQQDTLGQLVGYSVRFQNKVSTQTKIKFMTDGMLLRESLINPLLEQYSILIIDQAHQRSVNTDILLGILKSLLIKRPDLKVIIMSATIQATKFCQFFNTREYLQVEGRNYQVQKLHTISKQNDYIDACMIAIIQVHLDYPTGDILVFLTGQQQIQDLQVILMKKRKLLPDGSLDFTVIPMYAALPASKQLKVFKQSSSRKIILATNIAETSLTISGIKYVIDTGMVKQRNFDPLSGIESLKVERISQAAANQRSGRAGRQSDGKCFRIYTRQEFKAFCEYTPPEITRSNLSGPILQLKILGEDPRIFPFIDKPKDSFVQNAIKLLKSLGALNLREEITLTGRRMAQLPLPVILSKILLASLDFECTKDILTIVSLLSVQNLCYFGKDQVNAKHVFRSPQGDHLTLLRVYKEWRKNRSKKWASSHGINRIAIKRVKMIRKQVKQYMSKYKPVYKRVEQDTVLRCLAQGLFMNTAVLQNDGIHYRLLKENQLVYMHPSSVLFNARKKPKCVMFSEMVMTSKKYMREVSEIDLAYIESINKQY